MNTTCDTCKGKGYLTQYDADAGGFEKEDCGDCEGTGQAKRSMNVYDKLNRVFWYAIMSNNYTAITRDQGDATGRRLGEIERHVYVEAGFAR